MNLKYLQVYTYRPDIKEINMALEEFDTMLHEYEIDLDQKGF